MKNTKIGLISLNRSWLYESYISQHTLLKELVIKDEKKLEKARDYADQIITIIFDYLARRFFKKIIAGSTDSMIISKKQGMDNRIDYRVEDTLHVMAGKIFILRQEYAKVSKEKEKPEDPEHFSWFMKAVKFPEEKFKKEFLLLITPRPMMQNHESIDYANVKKLIRNEIFANKIPNYLNQPVADYFFS